MHTIYTMLHLIGDAIDSALGWFFQFVEAVGMSAGVFLGLMATLLAVDLLITFVRVRAIGSLMSDNTTKAYNQGGKQ